jgi:hypothetical protein
MTKTITNIFTIWVNDKSRVISLKEIKGYTPLVFDNKEEGLVHIQKLIAKGYKIG